MFLKLERPEMGDLAKENFGCKRKMSIFSSILNPSSLLQHLRRSIHICYSYDKVFHDNMRKTPAPPLECNFYDALPLENCN